MPNLRLNVREPHASRGIGGADEMLAGRSLDLAAGELRIALQRLVAVRSVEFEFGCAHGLQLFMRKTRLKSFCIIHILFLPKNRMVQ